MNATEISAMCKEIYQKETYLGRPKQTYDNQILALIMYMYNHTEIDYEEVKWLWTQYLLNGKLDFHLAIQCARERIAEAKDIRATEEELIAWLHRGI